MAIIAVGFSPLTLSTCNTEVNIDGGVRSDRLTSIDCRTRRFFGILLHLFDMFLVQLIIVTIFTGNPVFTIPHQVKEVARRRFVCRITC